MNRLKTLPTHLFRTAKLPNLHHHNHFPPLSAKMSTLTPSQLNTLATHLRTLYNPSSPLILPNVWDASSALAILSHPGITALATASYAIAMMQGVEDAELSLEMNLQGIDMIARGLRKSGREAEVPLTADLQDGYHDVRETVRGAVERGVVGCNIEDADNSYATAEEGGFRLRSVDDAVSRIKIVLATAKEMGVGEFVVNARTDVFGKPDGSLEEIIERGKKYLDAGATSVFVWGVGKHVVTEEEVNRLVEAFEGRLAVQSGEIGIRRLKELGVARVSIGPELWRKSIQVVKSEGMKVLEA